MRIVTDNKNIRIKRRKNAKSQTHTQIHIHVHIQTSIKTISTVYELCTRAILLQIINKCLLKLLF